jgi:TolB-like protein/Tfp pilus assembly protein PilF
MQPSVYRFDPFELRTRTRELYKHGIRLKLRPQPFQVLQALVERSGDVVTREELRQHLWPAETFVDFEHGLNTSIKELRGLLSDSASEPRYIETLPRLGYRIIVRVEVSEAPANGKAVEQVKPETPRGIQAVAVLPLEDLSGDPGHDYFADGMTEALINSLAKIKALRVISRTSAMQYKGARKSLPQIARELNVDAVIEGSVLRSGERVRIVAQLIHASSDQHLWAESYERDFRDILSLQSEIARQIANEVRIILTPEERARLGSARQVNPEAHEWYLKARYYWNKRTEESVKKALSYFHRAIDTDPSYAQGYAGLADSYNILGYYNALPPTEAYQKGKAAALKALELDNSLAEPHAALGVVKRDFEWDWSGAQEEFQLAIELNPGYVEAYHWRATLLSMMGRHAEALREKNRALAIDPLSVVIRTDLARMSYFARDYDQSLEQYRAALDMDPNFGLAHLWLAHVYEQKGLFEQAISELKTGMRLSSDSTFALGKLGHGYAMAGRCGEAHAVLNQLKALSSQGYISAYDIAMVHVGLQEIDEAFAWLQRAFEQRSIWLGYLNVEPQLDQLRSDERFQELLHRVGLAHSPSRLDHDSLRLPMPPPTAESRLGIGSRWKVILPLAVALLALAVGSYFLLHRTPKLTDRDTIVLGDFTNTTGDAVFDGTLREGLAVQLEQSPYLSLIPDARILQTLKMMGQSADAHLTPEIAREICQRTASAATLNGSIAQIGARYAVILKAVNCARGESLGSSEAEAADKTHVLDALGKAASEIRNKLGESLSTVQQFETPVEEASTSSLEALQAFSLGGKMQSADDFANSIPVFQDAIKLDPNFAMAYAALATDNGNIGEPGLAAENARKAYELRDRVSEREKFYIDSHYHTYATGDLEKARHVYELWARSYPRDEVPLINSGVIDDYLGEYEKALAEGQQAFRLNPSGLTYYNLECFFTLLNRFEEARALAGEAQAKKLDSAYLRLGLYQLDFLRNDPAGMAEQIAWTTGKPGVEDIGLSVAAGTAAFSGQLRKARELSRQAILSAELAEEKETAATYEAQAGLREALFGNSVQGRERASAALHLSTGRDVQFLAALALAVAGDATRAQALTDDFNKRFPEDTVVRFLCLPSIRAQLALVHRDALRAIDLLQSAFHYELGEVGFGKELALYPVYMRGEAYRASGQGGEAVREFQKILDHRGVVLYEPIGALAHLQIGRAYTLQGDAPKARTAYQDFFALWKDADSDIPILREAKAEYARLK